MTRAQKPSKQFVFPSFKYFFFLKTNLTFIILKCYLLFKLLQLNIMKLLFKSIFGSKCDTLTLSLLGYLKTRICNGQGGNLTPPPSKSHVWCPNMTNDTSLESSCALLLESAKKSLQIFNNWIFYRKIQLYSKNVCKKKFVQKMKNYTFLKSPWPCHFKYAKIFAKS